MKRSAQFALFLLLSYPVLSLSVSIPRSMGAVASFCGHTHDPKLCISASRPFARAYLAEEIDAQAVLQMHLTAISKRCRGAKNKAGQLMRRAGPNVQAALKNCTGLYSNAIDLIGVSARAINAHDGQTKTMVQIMLQEIQQSMQQCDLQFQRLGVSNPMARFDTSITKMTINCDDLNALI